MKKMYRHEKIQRLCYELYKIDWKRSHMITPDVEMNMLKDYHKGMVDDLEEYSYDDYIEEFGYNGELYVCFEEFLDAEFRDEEYMSSLLEDNELITVYRMSLR